MNAIDIVKEQAAAYDAGKSFAVVTIVRSPTAPHPEAAAR